MFRRLINIFALFFTDHIRTPVIVLLLNNNDDAEYRAFCSHVVNCNFLSANLCVVVHVLQLNSLSPAAASFKRILNAPKHI